MKNIGNPGSDPPDTYVERLEDEIARLRAALEEIQTFKIRDSNGFEVVEDSLYEIRKKARKALADEEGK